MADAEFSDALRDYAQLSAPDRHAIEKRLSPVERARVKDLLKKVAPSRAEKEPAAALAAKAFQKCTPALAAHLVALINGRADAAAKATEATRRAVEIVAVQRAAKAAS